MSQSELKNLPAVSTLLTPDLEERFGHPRVVAAIREVLAHAREHASRDGVPSAEVLQGRVEERLARRVRAVINASGIALHTNIGRAPWSEGAVAAAAEASGYCTLEIDFVTGQRSRRGEGAIDRLCALTGAEAALVVNNCAAALVLAVTALARDRGVLISRGQLVEIGGGFRIPDIIETCGARLVEVGSTNRTHLRDYENALTDDIGAILHVHQSNFSQVGYVSDVSLSDLAKLDAPLIADLGSGAMLPIGGEPTVGDALSAGASLVCFSGDKLLGGPQTGLIVGKSEWVEKLATHPLMRAMRPGKVSLAALEATLDDILTQNPLPLQKVLEADPEDLRRAVERWKEQMPADVACEVVASQAEVGGGTLPTYELPSFALRIAEPNPNKLNRALLRQSPPVVARLSDGSLFLDARTVSPLGSDDSMLGSLLNAIRQLGA